MLRERQITKLINRIRFTIQKRRAEKCKAALTVETALVLPIFMYFFIAFLYFLQIITLQEHIQQSITKTGLTIAKTAYIYSDFLNREEAENFDQSLVGEDFEVTIEEFTGAVLNGTLIKMLVKKDLDTNLINNSCIQEGYYGISFYDSSILTEEDCIDIVVRYRIRLPIPLFHLKDLRMIQRVKLRSWTGHPVQATYTVVEEGEETEEAFVYITETGTVYHLRENCSHLSFTIIEITGIPVLERNQSGGRYYPCEACIEDSTKGERNYYITAFGERYHSSRSCVKLKRTVRKIPISEVSNRAVCKRCNKSN